MPQTEEERKHYPERVNQMDGEGDLENGLNTQAAAALKSQLRSMSPAQVRAFFESLSTAVGHGHGTHVAGIAARDNPVIRLAYALITYDNHNPHLPPTV